MQKTKIAVSIACSLVLAMLIYLGFNSKLDNLKIANAGRVQHIEKAKPKSELKPEAVLEKSLSDSKETAIKKMLKTKRSFFKEWPCFFNLYRRCG